VSHPTHQCFLHDLYYTGSPRSVITKDVLDNLLIFIGVVLRLDSWLHQQKNMLFMEKETSMLKENLQRSINETNESH